MGLTHTVVISFSDGCTQTTPGFTSHDSADAFGKSAQGDGEVTVVGYKITPVEDDTIDTDDEG